MAAQELPSTMLQSGPMTNAARDERLLRMGKAIQT